MQHAANRVSYTCEYRFAETQIGYAHGPLLFAAAMNVFGPVLSCCCQTPGILRFRFPRLFFIPLILFSGTDAPAPRIT